MAQQAYRHRVIREEVRGRSHASECLNKCTATGLYVIMGGDCNTYRRVRLRNLKGRKFRVHEKIILKRIIKITEEGCVLDEFDSV